MTTREFRRRFYRELLFACRVVWPVLSGLLLVIALAGVLVSHLEGWRMFDGVYFAFVTSLTIGYGDFAPTHLLTKAIALVIGATGILWTALVAAISVRALQAAQEKPADRMDGQG